MSLSFFVVFILSFSGLSVFSVLCSLVFMCSVSFLYYFILFLCVRILVFLSEKEKETITPNDKQR